MEGSAVVVGRELRDPLRMAALLELSNGAEEMDCALTQENAADMVECRARFEAAARLLDDLGWAENDKRQGFGITIGTDRLTPLLARIDQTTTHALVGYARMLKASPSRLETPRERHDRLVAIREYCDQDLDMRTAARALSDALDRKPPG
jgi:hypothetical protein